MVPSDTPRPTLPSGSRCRRLAALSFTLTALLFPIAAPQVHAQNSTDQWAAGGGTVEVSTATLTIPEGESRTYRFRLTKPLPIENGSQVGGWWVMVKVDGVTRHDGVYDSNGDGQRDIRWVPSVGRQFDPPDWPMNSDPMNSDPSHWRGITVTALEDDDSEDATITFTHEVWDHNSYCPDALHPDNLPKITVHVIDNDLAVGELPTVSIGDAEVNEGGTALFKVTLNAASQEVVTVGYETRNGTARAGSDYDAVNGTLTFPAGTTEQTILVQTKEDNAYEGDETFTVRLSGPNRATIDDGTGDGTITNDDVPPKLSIGNATVKEGDMAEFEVTLTPESSLPVAVQYETMDDSAIDGSDYTGTSGTLTFGPGTTSRTIHVSTRVDNAREPVETFTVVLSGPENATVDSGTGTGTITDDDQEELPSLRIADATVTEGGTARFEVSLSVPSDQTVTVEYETRDGTASAGSDYTAKPATLLSIPAQAMQGTIEVGTLPDENYEGSEAFTVRLRNPSGATLDRGTGTGTIEDDDPPGVSVNDVTVREGSAAQFTVTLAGPANRTVTVTAATSDGTAEAGDDYTAKSETLTFIVGQTSATFSVDTIDGPERESDEDFTVTLSNPTGATLDDATGQGTIMDDDDGGGTTPQLSIGDASVEEGETAQFTVTLSQAANETVTVEFQTADGTAAAGDDYTQTSGTLTFDAGDTTTTFSVLTTEDDTQESDEDFTVTLSNPTGATLDDATGQGTIMDDDDGGGTTPQLSIGDASVEEGETAQFTVTLSQAANETVTVEFQTADGTAAAGDDYTQTSGTLTFDAGDTTTTFSVLTTEDDTQESDEDFTVTLSSPTGATLDDATGQGTIMDDDDGGGTTPQLSIGDASVEEGETAQFTVTLSQAANETVTVEFQTADGTAAAGDDYTQTSGTLTFDASDTTTTFSVLTTEDDTQESDEDFTVTLSNPTGATLDDATGQGTIMDDDDGGGTTPQLSIGDASVEEGETAQFTVTLSQAANETVTVEFQTADGTAAAGDDYTQTSGTLTFDASDTTTTFSVLTIEDDTQESDEDFTVTLSNPTGATLDDATGQGTITDDDDAPQLSIGDVSVEEGETAQFTVTLSKAANVAVTVEFQTNDGTAAAGDDYTQTSGTLTFNAGDRTKTISVQTTEDDTQESDEDFTVTLSNPTRATLDDATGQGTIMDDDDGGGTLPQLSIGDASVEEGETAQFTVTLSKAANETVTVEFQTNDGTAAAGDDYTQTSGTLTFNAGDRTKTISVQTTEDDTQESDEDFTVTLSNPTGATLDDATGQGTITDDDDAPQLSIGDASVEEGETAQFTVTLSKAANVAVTVEFQTADGTAAAGDDYTQTSGTLTFDAGDTTTTFSVLTTEDDTQESDEDFTVTLSNPTGATLDDATGQGTITDDDDAPQLSIGDVSVEEGETAQFTVTLSKAANVAVTVEFQTNDGTAAAGDDYTQTSGTLTFNAGDRTKTISVQTTEDDTQESDEDFTVTLSNPTRATLDDATGQGTIMDDDDGGGTLPQLSIGDASVEEGETAQFTVTLSKAANETVTVEFQTNDGTAAAGDDYTQTSGTLTFNAGDRTKTISVQTTEDDTQESDEDFTVTLSNPTGATLDDATGQGTITDDDDAPQLSIGDASVEEGETAQFTVTLSKAANVAVTVEFQTNDGTAEVGADYTGTSGTLTFTPTENSKTISVPTVEDTTDEETETFTVTLSNPSGATIQDGTATGTITDDDEPPPPPLPTLAIEDAEAEEGDPAEFTVTLSGTRTGNVTVDYATADGTAEVGADYTGTSGTLTFTPTENSKTISVPTVEDTTDEETETFTVTLSNPSGATIQDGTATGTITDDDEPPTLSIADAEVEEGEQAEFTVTLSAASARTVTVDYATADDTATGGADYTSTSGTLEFAPGEDSKTIQVTTLEDDVDEETETFTLTLSNPSGATIQDGTATGTITDDDEPPLPNLSIADAEAKEGDTAEFLVMLRPSSDETVAVSFRTVDETAVAGIDYTSAMGTLRFEPGETSATIAVSTFTDEMAEGPERFTLELSDPVGATVADGTGVGTITDDHMARIGTVNRIILPEVGRALAFNAVTCRFDRSLSEPMAGDGTTRPVGRLSLSRALVPNRSTPAGSRQGGHGAASLSPALISDPWNSPTGGPLTLEQVLGDSSFLLPSTDEQGGAGRFSAWGCADYRRLGGGGVEGGVSWNGVAFSAQVGADVELGADTLAGVSISRSRGSFGYYGGAGDPDRDGMNELRLTGVHPYLAWSVSPDLDVWGTVGHAWGQFQLEDNLGAGALMSAATLNSGAVGINGRLLARGTTLLRVKGEGGLAQLGVAGDGETLEAMSLDMRRLRLSTEASHEHAFSFGGTLTPWGELGLRHDGGDGETGAGLEVRGGLRYRDLVRGLTVEGYGRRLVVHEGAVRESGFGAMIRVDPGASGLGPSLSLSPTWGSTASGVQQLWERGATGLTMHDAPGTHLNAQFAYGFAGLHGPGLVTPYGAVSLARKDGRGYGLGARLAVRRSLTLNLEVERRERITTAAVHAFMVRGALQF